MTILLRWLVEYAWIFYAVCAIGAIIYVARALAAQRERNLALFTLEREIATSRAVRAWTMVLVFIAIGAAVFFSVTVILPDLSIYSPSVPLPTSTLVAGVETPVPGTAPASPTPASVAPTLAPMATNLPVPTPLPPPPTEAPTPLPTATPEGAISGEIHIRFGNVAELVSYSLPAAQVTSAQPLLLTLQWKALEEVGQTGYLVFTHLLSEDGRLIAQHDGAPAGGTRPTDTWAPGETIVDSHLMAFYDAAFAGSAKIVVGLYDPATGRLLTDTGEDRVVLPVTISIVP